ncbi:MAG TPA: surface-adhesin E family protein [Syntrophales bacterium]|nr:surface-adhesin E family protein [Syntrophales bacterium]
MRKAKNVYRISCFVVLFLFILANHAGAADWILFGQTATGDAYYDKSNIYEAGGIIRVWTKDIYSKEGKMNTYQIMKNLGHAIASPDVLSHQLILREFDCANEKMQSTALTVYTIDGAAIFSQSKSFDERKDIAPGSIFETLKNIVCNGGKTSRTK